MTLSIDLSRAERRVLRVVTRGGVRGIPLPRLAARCDFDPAEALARLLVTPEFDRPWLRIEGSRVRPSPWAVVWAQDHVRPHRTIAEPDHFSDDRALPGGPATMLLTGVEIVWREQHRYGCPCEACREPLSATRPRPASCSSCKGRRLPPLWECLRCGRGGRDRILPPLPKAMTTAPKDDDGLKGGTG